jgi:hypothetical protein
MPPPVVVHPADPGAVAGLVGLDRELMAVAPNRPDSDSVDPKDAKAARAEQRVRA